VPAQDSVKQMRPVETSARAERISSPKNAMTQSQLENHLTNRETIKTKSIQTPSHSDSENPNLSMKDEIQVNESEIYEQVWKEIEKNKTDIGLWAKCFASCEGDENKTKALYIKKRISVIKKEIENQSLEAQKIEQEKLEKEKDLKLSILKGKADSIEEFSKTIKEKPDFFPGILKKYGYNLSQNENRPEMWTFRLPNGTGVKHTYNIYELRTEIIKIIEEQEATAETESMSGLDDAEKRKFENRTLSGKVFLRSLEQYPDYFNDLLYQAGGYRLAQKGKGKWEITSKKDSVVHHMISIDQLLFFVRKVVNNLDTRTPFPGNQKN
jgi:hypothetical protein